MESSHAAKEGGPWRGWLRHRIRSKNRRRWLIGLAIVVTATAIFIFNSTRPPTREERIAAALQDLRRQVTRMDNARTAVWNALPSMLQNYTVGLLPTDPMQLRKYACHELVELNADSREVIDALAAALDDPRGMYPVLAALQHFGPRAARALERLIAIRSAPKLLDYEPYLETLAAIAPTNSEVVSIFLSGLSLTNQMLWSAARIMKSKAGMYGEATQDRILQKCKDAPPQFTVPILLSIDPNSERTRALALEFLRTNQLSMRQMAVQTLAETGTTDERIVRILMQVPEWNPFHAGGWGRAVSSSFHVPLVHMPYLAITALGKSGRAAAPAVPLLRRMLEDPRHLILHDECALALWRITGDAKQLRAFFEPKIQSDSTADFHLTMGSLFTIAQECPEATELIARGLQHKDKNIRLRTVNMLGTLGEKAKTHAPALEALQHDPVESVRNIATTALKRIRGDAPKAKAER